MSGADASAAVHSRLIDATPQQVFDAVRDPARLARWWGPNGFTSTFHAFDFREGGEWRFDLHGPDGKDYPNTNVFAEIVEPHRIVIDHPSQTHHFVLTMTLEGEGRGTRVGWRQQFDTVEHYREIGEFVAAANEQNLDRLAAEVARGG